MGLRKGCGNNFSICSKMLDERNKMLQKYVTMYGHRIKEHVDSYRSDDDPRALFSVVKYSDDIVPDMSISSYTREDLIEKYKEKPSFALVMNQFQTADFSKQCVMGLVFPDDIISHVLQVRKSKQ